MSSERAHRGLDAGGDRALRELERPHVGLGEHDLAEQPEGTHVLAHHEVLRERVARGVGVFARRHLAAVVDQAGEAQLRDDVDRAPSRRCPWVPTSPPITWSSITPFVEHDALDRALGGAHPEEDLAALERGPRRCGGGDGALGVAARDLAVRADVDEQARLRVAHEPGRHDVRDDVRARRRRRSRGRSPTHPSGCIENPSWSARTSWASVNVAT